MKGTAVQLADASSSTSFPASRLRNLAVLVAPLALAALLRFVVLGERPLNPDEARIALAGLMLWREGPLSAELSPVLPNLLSLLFGAFGAADGLARLPTAAAGVALAAIPLLLRSRLGLRPAIAASWLLACSPLLVLSSRTLGGAMLGLLALGLVVACWHGWAEQRHPGWLAALGAALVLGLGAITSFVPWLLVVAVAAVLAWSGRGARSALEKLRGQWRPFALGVGLAVVVLDTRLLTAPGGLQTGLADPLWRWSPLLTSGLEPRNLALLATVEVTLLVGALVGLLAGLRRGLDPFARFLGLWFVLSLLLTLSRAAPLTEGLVGPLLPGALLAGRAISAAWSMLRACAVWRPLLFAALGWVLVGYVVLNGLSAARANGPFPRLQAIIALAGFALVAVLVTTWLRADEQRSSGIILASGVALVVVVAFVGRLSLRQDDVPMLPGEWNTSLSRQITPEALLWSRQNIPERLTIQPQAERWLRWSLRDVPLAVVEEGTSARVVAVPEAAVRRDGLQGPAGLPVGVRVQWADGAGIAGWWRWLTWGRDWVVAKPYAIILARP